MIFPPEGRDDSAEPRLVVGLNYDRYRHWLGQTFGPDHSVNPNVGGDIGPATKEEWLAAFDRFAGRAAGLGLEVLRIHVLANAWAYGTGADASFVQPSAASDGALWRATIAAYREQLGRVLSGCRSAGLRVIPVFIGFNAFNEAGNREVGGGGRLRLVLDPDARERLFDDLLEPLLEVSDGYRDSILAWETVNEPVWPTRSWLAWGARLARVWNCAPQVPRARMQEFLLAAHARLARAGFVATTGHVFEAGYSLLGLPLDDETRFPAPREIRYLRQMHWYPDGTTRRSLPRHATTRAFVGELSTRPGVRGSRNPEHWPWPELGGTDGFGSYDAVTARLRRLAAQGYELALLWPNQEHLPGSDSMLDVGAEEAVRDFCGRSPA